MKVLHFAANKLVLEEYTVPFADYGCKHPDV